MRFFWDIQYVTNALPSLTSVLLSRLALDLRETGHLEFAGSTDDGSMSADSMMFAEPEDDTCRLSVVSLVRDVEGQTFDTVPTSKVYD